MQGDKNNSKITLQIPPIIFGTSGLGNLFSVLDERTKYDIIKECIINSQGKAVFDTAGKYGAGLALETLGKYLRKLNIKPKDLIISNKLGWIRTPLKTEEPTFEPGVWKNLKFDAVQKISYDGILECFEQGNELLKGYIPQMVSVHDPDEYLATAQNDQQAECLYNDILSAYKALYDLKNQGTVQAIGVGAKDWRIIKKIAGDVPLDWIMIANSMTIKNHPEELAVFIEELSRKGVFIINSAVFHSGFLVGGNFYDYKLVRAGTPYTDSLIQWRQGFLTICKEWGITPAEACVQFALRIPGVSSIALNTTSAGRVKENIAMGQKIIPAEFWKYLKAKKFITWDLN